MCYSCKQMHIYLKKRNCYMKLNHQIESFVRVHFVHELLFELNFILILSLRSTTASCQMGAVGILFERKLFHPFLHPAVHAVRCLSACIPSTHAQTHRTMAHNRIALGRCAVNWAIFAYLVFACLSRKCRKFSPNSRSTLHPEYSKEKE